MDPRLLGILQIFTRAPWWVWPLLAGLVFGGVIRLKTRPVPLATLFIAPAIYLVWGVASLAVRLSGRPEFALPWLGAAVLGAAVGWLTTPTTVLADRRSRRVHIPGSAGTLIAGLAVFTLKYACNVALALRPADRDLIAAIDMAVSGASTGFFWSGLAHLLLRYRKAPDFASSGASASSQDSSRSEPAVVTA